MNPLLKKILRPIVKNRFINFFRRILVASSYFNSRYLQIVKWGFQSREDTNFTYDITPASKLYLAHTIASVLCQPVEDILALFNEVENDYLLRNHVANETAYSPYRVNADKQGFLWTAIRLVCFCEVVKAPVGSGDWCR